MAVLLESDRLYSVKYFCRLGVQTAVNVRHLFVDNIVGPYELQGFADDLSFFFATAVAPALNTNAFYRGARIRRENPNPKGDPIDSVTGAGVGGGSGDPLPPQICGLLKYSTGFAGRAYRGRMYVPFPSESRNNVDGKPDATYLALLQTLGNIHVGVVAGGAPGINWDGHWVLFHPEDSTWTSIVTASPRVNWGTQRRRATNRPSDADFPGD